MTKLSIEEKRDIYQVALLIEEDNMYGSGGYDCDSPKSTGSEIMCWNEWKMDFFGCCDEGWRKILDNVYRSKVADTRKSRTLEERSIIWKFWNRVAKARLIGDGLHISKVINK